MNNQHDVRSAGLAQQGSSYTTTAAFSNKAEQPTRFSQCSARLDARTAHLAGLIDRASRVADRLGGSIPEPVSENKPLSGGGCIASQIERALDDVDALTTRFEGVLQRLETL